MVSKQTGRSMVEMLGVLAIIGVLSVGGIAGYSKAMYKYKINKFTDQMNNIIANIRASFGAQKSVNGLNNANIKKMGLVPEDMYKNKNSDYPLHSWGGEIYFGAASTYDSNTMSRPMYLDDVFYISMNKVPKDVCITVLTADWGSDLVGMGASFMGGSPVPPDNAKTTASKYYAVPGDKKFPAPFSLTRAEDVCSEGEKVYNSTSGMTLYWYFGL